MKKVLKKLTRSIVLIGEFNPIIFQPAWFSAQKLIGEKESEAAKVKIIHPDIVSFEIGEWCQCEILRGRVYFNAFSEEYFDPMRDLILGTFKLLKYTPISKMGLNFEFHYKIDTKENWELIGDKLAPKDIWKEVMHAPKLQTIEIIEVDDDNEEYYNKKQVRIEPSHLGEQVLLFNINDHFELKYKEGDKEIKNAEKITDLIELKWTESLNQSKNLTDKIMDKLC